MRKATKVTALALIAAFALAGCGDKKTTGTSATTGNVAQQTQSNTATTQADDSYKEKIETLYTGITEYGYTYLNINSSSATGNFMYINAPYEYADGTSFNSEKEYVVEYSSADISGKQIVFTKSNGAKENWIYDEETNTVTDGKVTFYSHEDDLIKNEFVKSDEILTDIFTGNYTENWGVFNGYLKNGDKTVAFQFSKDGTVTSTISDNYEFLDSSKYCVKGNTIYVYCDIENSIKIYGGTYDKAAGTIDLNGLKLKK